VEGRNTTINIG
jgi:hypothetical protein